MKRFALFVLSVLSYLFLFPQNNSVFEGPEIDVGYNGVGAIKGTAGIIGDNYYVVENDYGKALDFNNNIRTIVSILSLKTGNLVKRVLLNDLVAEESNQKINKVLFCGVVTWNDKIVGFYTFKDPKGTVFKAYAIILDQEGRLEKSVQDIGAFTHELLREYIPDQIPGRTGGRNTLSVVNDLKFCFTPDSSHLLVQCAPENRQSNIHFKVYKRGMLLEKEITALIPIKGKQENVEQFAMDNTGMIYLLTKGDKYTLHSINTAQNNQVVSRDLELAGKDIHTVSLGLTEKGTPIITGAYHDASKKVGMHGVFTFRGDRSAARFAVNTKDIPDSVIETHESKKALKKEEGLSEFVQFIRFTPKKGGGLYAFGQSNLTIEVTRGTTGALNSYYEQTWLNAAYSINEEGKILWESISGLQIQNRELATRHSRIEYAPVGESVHGLIIMPKPNGIHDYRASATGTNELQLGGSKEIMNYPFVEGTIRQIGENVFAVIGFNDGRNPKMRLIKIRL
jgi:hypothetical protein